jgi:hypothetical protein
VNSAALSYRFAKTAIRFAEPSTALPCPILPGFSGTAPPYCTVKNPTCAPAQPSASTSKQNKELNAERFDRHGIQLNKGIVHNI